MIERISVRNLVLVEELELEFGTGLSVLTGETGAGKSVLVSALSLLCGARGSADMVRVGADEAVVAGSFVVEGLPEVEEWLRSRELQTDDGVVLVRRTLKSSGRGAMYIQSTPVARSDLAEFAALLIDLHSQHEHQSLFVETNHRALLDRYAGLEEQVTSFAATFQQLSERQSEYRALESRERDRERELEMARFAVEEIDAVAPEAEEEQLLTNERDTLAQFEKLTQHVELLYDALGGPEGGALRALKNARAEAGVAARIDQRLQAVGERLDGAFYELEDVQRTVADYRDGLTFDPARLDTIEERLAVLRKLYRKYGADHAAVMDYRSQAEQRIQELTNFEENKALLRTAVARLEREVTERARDLHQKRSAAAIELGREVTAILQELAMERATFHVRVEQRTSDAGKLICNTTGADAVRFLIAPNRGEPERPLQTIASGGEISRVMLAIKTVLAETDHVSSLVFDEIDTGIGGQVALAVARHLHGLARYKQVICITHLASIAAHADNHTVVEKSQVGERTLITVKPVAASDREREIARMLSGDPVGAASLDHARAMLAKFRSE